MYAHLSRRLLADEQLERYLSEIVEDLALADGQFSACIAQPLVTHPARSLPETLASLRARGIRLVLTDVGYEHDATDIVPHGFAELRLSREIVVGCDVDAARALVVRETAAFAARPRAVSERGGRRNAGRSSTSSPKPVATSQSGACSVSRCLPAKRSDDPDRLGEVAGDGVAVRRGRSSAGSSRRADRFGLPAPGAEPAAARRARRARHVAFEHDPLARALRAAGRATGPPRAAPACTGGSARS